MLRGPLPRALGLLSLALMVSTAVTHADSPAALGPFQFLLGQWEAIGDQSGATGGFTFSASVQDRVIVRTNYSISPATSGKPASRHDDLMVIYIDAGVVKADYFDSESHVIRYIAEARSAEVVFLSEVKASEPRYRLTYRRGSAATIDGTFEVAPPGKPDAFASYLSWTARRVK